MAHRPLATLPEHDEDDGPPPIPTVGPSRATWKEWTVIVASGLVIALAVIAVCTLHGCRGVSVYGETNGWTTEGPKGGNVREQDSEGWTLGVSFDLGEIFLPPRPQPVYMVPAPAQAKPDSWPTTLPPAAHLEVGTGLAWPDPFWTAHDFRESGPLDRCCNCDRTRAEIVLAGEGS